MSEWRPISTGPNTGSHTKPVLLWWKGVGVGLGFWDVDEHFSERPKSWVSPECGWRCVDDHCIPRNQDFCTHWMPLPEGPEK